MFDMNNKERIMQLVDGKPTGNMFEPLYVKLYDKRYGFDELDLIEDFNPSSFKVGFGSCIGLFLKKPLKTEMIPYLDIVGNFKMFKEDLQCERLYYIFEAGIVNGNDPLIDMFVEYSQVEMYVNKVREYLEKKTEEIRRKRIESLISEGMVYKDNEQNGNFTRVSWIYYVCWMLLLCTSIHQEIVW